MKTMNKILSLCLAVVLVGCSSKDSSGTHPGEYAPIIPFETSDTRVKHVGLISDQNLRMEVESGLMDLSKKHFAPGEVEYKTHTLLNFDELDATDGSRGLLGTLRDDNPVGLNPSRNIPFDTGNGEVKEATILVDIYELDWYANDKLKGISLAMVVSDKVGPDGSEVEITSEKLKNYIEVSSGQLVNYMRQRFNEVSTNVPIYVAAYALDSTGVTNGGYFYDGIFSGTSSHFSSLNEKWVLVPSDEFATFDPVTSTEFATYKEDLRNVLPDYTYITGKAKYNGKNLVRLDLEVTAHAKTAAEILAITQIANKSLAVFENLECQYQVKIINDDEVYGLINRQVDTKETTISTTF